MAFKPEDIGFVNIFPPINVARVGDSDEYFIGPETPGYEPTPEGGFKDSEHRVKKQAACFRVYAFGKNGNLLGEITSKDYDFKWIVHVANKKAASVIFRGRYRKETWQLRNKTQQGWPNGKPTNYDFINTRTKLIIDSREQVIEGASAQPVQLAGEFWGSTNTATPVTLGELRTDSQGCLHVLAGDGHSFSITGDEELHSGFDNDNWVDKMFDGSVSVIVKSKSSPDLDIKTQHKATVIAAPPRFASGTHCQTTLLELIDDVYERKLRSKANYDVGNVDFHRHIKSLFDRIYLMSWTNKHALQGHGPRKADRFFNPEFANPNAGPEIVDARKKIFDRIRVPVKKDNPANEAKRLNQASASYMPRIGGDDGDITEGVADRWASLTELQYDRLKKWSEGNFSPGEPEKLYKSFDEIPPEERPDALTQSGLEWAVGAPLYPGIEVYWRAQDSDMYNPDAKYRLADSVKPGDLTRGLSLPWQSDFNMCADHWWPAVRPDHIVSESYFQQIKEQNVGNPDRIPVRLTKRAGWDDGIESNSDMVLKWNKLGFVAQQQYDDNPDALKVYVERQRDPQMPRPN
ncbi:hypothetical protein BDV93DRAFT_527603 [Ceratobasidium sp. AG-I]|nr:hypothetical protein BDV93DRAFT_527603 [Ceratobasidium sp. AG-I]